MERLESPKKQKDKAHEKKHGEREQEWRRSNREAIAAHNKRVDEHGTLLPPSWERDDD
jgi:post-segregation antitoxin (ccd killing protein)